MVSDHDCAAANVRNVNPEKTEGLSPELQSAPEPLLTGIVSLSEQIGEYSEHIKGLAQHSYPKVALLKAGQGRGPLIADLLADAGRPAASARAATWVAIWDCSQDRETPGRASRRCTSAKKATRICERYWCKGRSIFWARSASTVTFGAGA